MKEIVFFQKTYKAKRQLFEKRKEMRGKIKWIEN